MTRGHTVATVRHWSDDDGNGVLDSAATPGGCWADASVVRAGAGLRAGQVVHMTFEQRQEHGFDYVARRIEADDRLETAGG